MKINPLTNADILKSYPTVAPVKPKPEATIGRNATTGSEETSRFAKVLTEAKEALEIRTPEEKARIEDIKQSVIRGTYKVDSDKVAEKILESIYGK